MRRNAGSFVRGKMLQLVMLGTAGAGVAIGLSIFPLFYAISDVINEWIGPLWAMVAYFATMVAVLITIWMLDRPSYRWNFENLRKSVKAETYVGQVVEYAITAENCAVAHSVTEIAKVGDIDHIVATPVGIWVIETKYKKVPGKTFSEVLRRIAVNTDAVRKWAPDGTLVRGCLVLAYENENKIKKRNYSFNKEKIIVLNINLLMCNIRSETRAKQSLDKRIAKDIWKLGHVTE